MTTTNYWVARVESDAAVRKPASRVNLDLDDIWFIGGLLIIFTAAMLWAWSPVVTVGASAILYSLFWTAAWVTLCATAFVRTR